MLSPNHPKPKAAMFTRVNSTLSCFCNKRLQIDLPFTRTLACDQRRGSLIAVPNENILLNSDSSHLDLHHQSDCLCFSDSAVFDKVSTAISKAIRNYNYIPTF